MTSNDKIYWICVQNPRTDPALESGYGIFQQKIRERLITSDLVPMYLARHILSPYLRRGATYYFYLHEFCCSCILYSAFVLHVLSFRWFLGPTPSNGPSPPHPPPPHQDEVNSLCPASLPERGGGEEGSPSPLSLSRALYRTIWKSTVIWKVLKICLRYINT